MQHACLNDEITKQFAPLSLRKRAHFNAQYGHPFIIIIERLSSGSCNKPANALGSEVK